MKKSILFRLKEIPRKIIKAEFENKKIKFMHLSENYFCEKIEDIKENVIEIFKEDSEHMDLLIEKIKCDKNLIDRIEKSKSEKILIEYKLC